MQNELMKLGYKPIMHGEPTAEYYRFSHADDKSFIFQ